MRYQVILSPYVKDLGKVVDNEKDELLCNADVEVALWIAACLNACEHCTQAHVDAEGLMRDKLRIMKI